TTIGLAGLAVMQFAPHTWFHPFAWRERFQNQYRASLPGTLSPQPWISLEAILLFCFCLLWASYLLSRQWVQSRRSLLSLYAGGVVLLALCALGFYFADTFPPF